MPCGIGGFGITSITDLGLTTSMAELDAALLETFPPLLGALRRDG